MESAAKLDSSNAAPLPQRQQRGNQVNKNVGKHIPQKQNDASDGSPAEKKARFGPNSQNGGVTGGGVPGSAGGGGSGGGPNQNKNFVNNKGGFAGNNRNRNRGGNQNRPNFQGQNNAANVSKIYIYELYTNVSQVPSTRCVFRPFTRTVCIFIYTLLYFSDCECTYIHAYVYTYLSIFVCSLVQRTSPTHKLENVSYSLRYVCTYIYGYIQMNNSSSQKCPTK